MAASTQCVHTREQSVSHTPRAAAEQAVEQLPESTPGTSAGGQPLPSSVTAWRGGCSEQGFTGITYQLRLLREVGGTVMPARPLSDDSHPPHARVRTSSARRGAAPQTSSRVNRACHGGARPFRGRPAGSRPALDPSGTRSIERTQAGKGQRCAQRVAAMRAT